jgi:hypothetical protein
MPRDPKRAPKPNPARRAQSEATLTVDNPAIITIEKNREQFMTLLEDADPSEVFVICKKTRNLRELSPGETVDTIPLASLAIRLPSNSPLPTATIVRMLTEMPWIMLKGVTIDDSYPRRLVVSIDPRYPNAFVYVTAIDHDARDDEDDEDEDDEDDDPLNPLGTLGEFMSIRILARDYVRADGKSFCCGG